MINLSFLDEKNKYIEHMEKIPPKPTPPHMCRLVPPARAGRGRAGACGPGSSAVEGEFITRPLEPEKRLAAGRAQAKSQAVTTVMDNIDGLALSLSDLAQVSRVGFVVQEEALPVAAGLAEVVGPEIGAGDGDEHGRGL